MADASIVILSRRERPFVGWVAIDEFEDLFARLMGSTVLVPTSRPIAPGVLGRAQRKLIKDFRPLDDCPDKAELLLVVARGPGDLNAIQSVTKLRQRFRYVAGFVIDSYFTEAFGPAARRYDHIFTTTEIGAETVRTRFGVSSSILRQGFDCLTWACLDDDRSIDVIGFGRQPDSYHRAFQTSFHRVDSPILYLHSPIGATQGEAVWNERPMLLKLLQHSKVSIAFHLGVAPPPGRPFHADFITSRWFESLACGSIVVGKRPSGSMALDMLNWDDSTFELSDDPNAAAEMISALCSDHNYLSRTRRRNVVEMSRRHDWRHRIMQILRQFDIAPSDSLIAELGELKARDL